MSQDYSSRRVLSRNRTHDDENQASSRHASGSSSSRNESSGSRASTIVTTNKNAIQVAPKAENKENAETSINVSQSAASIQQNLAMNYINKEPFNEDLEIEESCLFTDGKWRSLVFERLRALIEEIKALQADPAGNKAYIRDKYRQGLLLFSTIKKLNRISHMRVNKERSKTHEEKNKIDEYHLELQNLLYEISHLQKEINKCLEFRSRDEDISLVPVEEFFTKGPSEIINPELIKSDEHKLKLARLDWELIERQNMTGRIKELENQIDLHEQDIKTKQNKLESLNPKLNQIVEACKPTLEYFNTNFDDDCMFSEQVQYLPKPLYQFYMMTNAYRDTIDRNISIEVNGELEEAKRFTLNEATVLEDEDSDSNDEDNENEAYKKKKSKSKSSKKKLSNREKVFTKYPLSCRVTVDVPNYGQVILEFYYLPILRIVTIKSDVKLAKESASGHENILKGENILNCLYPNDDGLESPNLSNKFVFSNVGVKSIEPYLKQIGAPYRWSQILCGLYYENKSDPGSLINFISSESQYRVSDATGDDKSTREQDAKTKTAGDGKDEPMNTNEDEEDGVILGGRELNDTELFEHIINKIKSRFKARFALQETINALKNLTVPTVDSYPITGLNVRIQSRLTNWKETSYDKFVQCAYAKHLTESNLLLNENDWSFYELTLLNSTASLDAQVAIYQDYPLVAPIFAISLNWKHERTYLNDEAIRDMEREINIYHDSFVNESGKCLARLQRLVSKRGNDSLNYDLLAKQINHLIVCFDIYLESESHYLRNHEFQRVKLFPNSVRGRDRKRPFMYLTGKDLFVQRMLNSDSTSSSS